MPGSLASTPPSLAARLVFSRVVVGVDGTEPGYEACRQAAALLQPDGRLSLVAVVDIGLTVHAGLSAPRLADELEQEATAALARGGEIAGPPASVRLLEGSPTPVLLHELERVGATLVAVGTHGRRRTTEILLGGVAGELLHRAPCSVLVARPPRTGDDFPRSLVVGIDGSAEAELALAVAQEVARRFDAGLRIVSALGGKGVEAARIHLRTPFAEEIDAKPVEALCAACSDADLLVVGTRGLHGVRALGSVSERVAHEAPCSVLVVRAQG